MEELLGPGDDSEIEDVGDEGGNGEELMMMTGTDQQPGSCNGIGGMSGASNGGAFEELLLRQGNSHVQQSGHVQQAGNSQNQVGLQGTQHPTL